MSFNLTKASKIKSNVRGNTFFSKLMKYNFVNPHFVGQIQSIISRVIQKWGLVEFRASLVLRVSSLYLLSIIRGKLCTQGQKLQFSARKSTKNNGKHKCCLKHLTSNSFVVVLAKWQKIILRIFHVKLAHSFVLIWYSTGCADWLVTTVLVTGLLVRAFL